MKYIKHFEYEQNIPKYKPDDMVIINKPEWQIIYEPAIVKEYKYDYYRCMFLYNSVFGDYTYVIMEEEILRKMTEEEIKDMEFKKNLEKYNL